MGSFALLLESKIFIYNDLFFYNSNFLYLSILGDYRQKLLINLSLTEVDLVLLSLALMCFSISHFLIGIICAHFKFLVVSKGIQS